MEDKIAYGQQEIKMIDRSTIILSGVNKIISFDNEEFLMETVMGNIHLTGESLELITLDTNNGNVKIRGKINGFEYLDGKAKNKEEGLIAKLLK